MKVFVIKEHRKNYSVNTVTGEWEYPPYKLEILEGDFTNTVETEKGIRYLVKVNGEILYFDNIFKTREDAEKSLQKQEKIIQQIVFWR